MAEGGGPHATSKFFSERGTIRALQEYNDETIPGLVDPANVSPRIAAVIRSKQATLYELQTVYSLKDLYDMMELAAVDAYNRRQISAHEEKARDAKNRT